jgi:predicted phage-related endonuclease
MIFEAEKHFWEFHIFEGNPPALDGSSAAEQYLKEKYERAESGKEIILPSAFKEYLASYQQIKSNEKAIEAAKRDIENKIKAELKDAESGLTDNFLITWKNQSRTSVDSKALKEKFPDVYKQVLKESSFRKLTIKELDN